MKKLLTLMIAPLFAVGMIACGTDEPADDIWTDEGQLPAYEDPAYDPTYETYQDTVVVPDTDPELQDDELMLEPEPEPDTELEPDTDPNY